MRFVHFAALEDFERFLFQRGFPRPIAHFRDLLLVGGEFGVEGGEFHVEAGDTAVDLCAL